MLSQQAQWASTGCPFCNCSENQHYVSFKILNCAYCKRQWFKDRRPCPGDDTKSAKVASLSGLPFKALFYLTHSIQVNAIKMWPGKCRNSWSVKPSALRLSQVRCKPTDDWWSQSLLYSQGYSVQLSTVIKISKLYTANGFWKFLPLSKGGLSNVVMRTASRLW